MDKPAKFLTFISIQVGPIEKPTEEVVRFSKRSFEHALRAYLDYIDETCDKAHIRIKATKCRACLAYSTKTRSRAFRISGLVLRCVQPNQIHNKLST
ncbi:unnamed protein product [Sphenostylis stenocarpa]|uniref:Uncharacterized protein n=1 Tax=Sphenostylis stenocarpa TaxID=92480 RepID=A0AA86SQK7_9FABA|nr:unnamed protein product [Sphenostylis stenocarpa]